MTAVNGHGLPEQVKNYLERSQLLLKGKVSVEHHVFLLSPGSVAGKNLSDEVALSFPDIKQAAWRGRPI
ncbi:MAG: hypothetical protein U0793_00960 [Gemmataceae bacterium]